MLLALLSPSPCLSFHDKSKTRVVSTKYGRLQGFVSRVGRDAEQQRHVQVFLGVPYASPPIGQHR